MTKIGVWGRLGIEWEPELFQNRKRSACLAGTLQIRDLFVFCCVSVSSIEFVVQLETEAEAKANIIATAEADAKAKAEAKAKANGNGNALQIQMQMQIKMQIQ